MVDDPDARNRHLVQEAVEVVAYDPNWPEAFRSEAALLRACLPADLVGRMEHFGSTAVPGLAAKPILDILVEVFDLQATRERIVPLLEARGYEYLWRPTRGDDGPPWYAWFIKRDPRSGRRTHHLHMVEPGMTEHWDRLLFRDALRADAGLACDYETLKRRLAAAHPRDRVAYTEGKSAFVGMVMRRMRGREEDP